MWATELKGGPDPKFFEKDNLQVSANLQINYYKS